MIPVLGTGGPGFNSRIAPFLPDPTDNVYSLLPSPPALFTLLLTHPFLYTHHYPIIGSPLNIQFYNSMNSQERRARQHSRSRSRSRDRIRSRSRSREDEQEEFQANQEIIRSLLRIEQNREQPIDKFVKVVWIYKGKLAFDSNAQELMTDPKIYLKRLPAGQLEQIVDSTLNFERTEKKLSNSYVNFWRALRVLATAVLCDKKGDNVINAAFLPKVQEILSKPEDELVKMKETIEQSLLGRGSGDNFWTCVRQKIEEKLSQTELKGFYDNYRLEHPEQQDEVQNQEEFEPKEPISPPLGAVSLVNHRLITTEQQEVAQRQMIAQKIFKDQFEKSREKLEENLSLPKNHNLLSTAIINDSTGAIDFITQQIIQFQKYKRLEQDEEPFDDWVPCETEGRFRDKKPQYINRRRVTIEWNKYNTMHYSEDNPPPKAVQGYKFNIFYPELLDKQKTPQYYLEPTESPDYCIIKFKAGPPYKDIAFKIQRREWEITEKSGFQSIFHKGILQLYFNFKKPKFRI